MKNGKKKKKKKKAIYLFKKKIWREGPLKIHLQIWYPFDIYNSALKFSCNVTHVYDLNVMHFCIKC